MQNGQTLKSLAEFDLCSKGCSKPRVVVLGASGFLGSAVISELALLPIQLRAVARSRTLVPDGAQADIEVCTVDLAEPGAVTKAVDGADAIIHLAADIGGEGAWRAAGSSERQEQVNVGLMHELVGSLPSREIPPVVVFASTLQAESAAGQNVYVQQKVAAEEALGKATAGGVVRGVVLRLSTLYGCSVLSGSTGRGVIAAMARRAAAGEPLTMWHDGSVKRDLLHVSDAARAFVASLRHAEALSGGRWVVGTGRMERLGEVFTTLAGAVAEQTGGQPVPVVSVDPPDYADAGDFHTVDADPTAFREATRWRPRVALRDGLDAVAAAAAKDPGASARL
ncbi:NAD-dependent epimerase/dehydratase family protein [Streptomyces noursei]|uniref:NAD-dependent epimerase/dehydratase family protein n=1 Tax=Streptomyces noursei TaxID=1971 RepID=UPI00081C8EA0|nr:dTDP-4-keto-6-deoxy-L-hexose 4-reductase [Streptomyces noursei ATCC 11455]MCZ0992650.1 NAD-dependent epimerase/dehydratase family protein [Streptomyces noursei]